MVLELTPSWLVAAVCTVFVGISFGFERVIHYTGKYLKKRNQKPLFDALQKVKEELMLLGFISLLLAVFEENIKKICVHEAVMQSSLLDLKPCSGSWPIQEGSEKSSHCHQKNTVQLLSQDDLHNLHRFIFALAIVHLTFCVLTVVIGGARLRQWKNWEDSFANESSDGSEQGMIPKFTLVREDDFIKHRFTGIEKYSTILGWLQCFLKQFYGSVSKSDYEALRRGFIDAHCKENPKFNFNNYMLRALEYDFKKIVGISWYLWVFAAIILLLNLNSWQTDFGIAFIPFILLLAIGTKLEHVITELAHEIAERHVAIEGEVVVKPSDDHFWFHRPQIVFFLIHFILFQNAFDITLLFWFLFQHGFKSCIVEQICFIVARIIIGVIIRLHCSYNTLPLYALVTQMGTHFKKSAFDEHVQAGIVVLNDAVNSSSDHGGSGGGATARSALEGLEMGGIDSFNHDGENPPPEITEIQDL